MVRQRPGGIAHPLCVCWDLLAFHEEGVGSEHCSVAHLHAVMDEGTDTESAADTEHGAVGLEGTIFQRVALDLAPCIERAVIPNDGKRPLRQICAVVEDPAANPYT